MADLNVAGQWFETSDFGGSLPVHTNPMTMPYKLKLKAVRTWIVLYNEPTLGTLSLRIYSNVGTSPGQLVATATKTWTRTDISEDLNDLLEVYFDFDEAIQLNQDTYHFALWCSGYTGTESSHLAWVKMCPDALNTGFTPTFENIAVAPFKVGLIGDRLI